jgi:ADP-heptose:LPS heptosyltransferase
MYAREPRKVRLEYGKRIWSEVFENNPKIARYEEQGDFQVYQARVNGLRPYASAKTATRWTWRDDYKPPVGEFFFYAYELAWASRLESRVIIEPNQKKSASPNKDWGWDRWQELVRLMVLAGLKVTQLGPRGTKRISGADLIETETFRHAAAALSRARAAVLPEGGLHHAAAAVGLRAVVIYGGYISPRQTGYDLHVNLFTGEKPCGMRLPCRHCDDAMAKISPEEVLERLRGIL